MKALVKTQKGVGHLELQEVSEPECGEDQVKIKIKAAGICGTDIHISRGEFKCHPPVILGHEFSGVITETGSKANKYKKGDRVTVLPSAAVTCGSCISCKMGYYCFCPTRRGMGHGVDGAFTEFCAVPEKIVYKLTANIDFVSGAFCEPLACCVQAVELAEIHAGDTVVISGPGVIGLLCLQIAKLEGARVAVFGTSLDEDRLSFASRLGADIVVNIEKESAKKVIDKFTKGLGVDITIDCSGAISSIDRCLELLHPLGIHIQMGHNKTMPAGFDLIVNKGLKVIGSLGHNWLHWERSLELLSQEKLNIKALVSHKLPLSEWKEGFTRVENKTSLKTILHPDKKHSLKELVT